VFNLTKTWFDKFTENGFSYINPNYLKTQLIKNIFPFTLILSKGRLSMVRQAHHERNSGYHEYTCFVKYTSSMITGIKLPLALSMSKDVEV